MFRRINSSSKRAINRKKEFPGAGAAECFIRMNKDHAEMAEYMEANKKRDLIMRCAIQKAVNRENWEHFLTTTQVQDLRQIFQYLARADGRKQQSYRPTCVYPLWGEIDNRWGCNPREKARLLGKVF